jgi:hypothetical protein
MSIWKPKMDIQRKKIKWNSLGIIPGLDLALVVAYYSIRGDYRLIMEPKEIILHLLENDSECRMLLNLYHGRVSFIQNGKSDNLGFRSKLPSELKFLDSAGLIMNILERTDDGYQLSYRISSFGKRVAEFMTGLA